MSKYNNHPDILLALAVGLIISLIVLPLPSWLLDLLLAINISASMVIVVSTLLADKSLSLSSFPSILLLTTLFRLGLNISSTRLILSQAAAGDIILAFGHFVAQGDMIIGLLMFLIITIVLLLVVAKGAERVAEVGARFTLDALPGKQMAIDADLRAGIISEQQAQRARTELTAESQFYGAMDGAMKFVKGDTIASLIITSLNLIAGILIGINRHNMSWLESIETYSLLTIGDGLVSQLPTLLITLSAGVLTTRVANESNQNSLGQKLGLELISNPRVLVQSAVFIILISLIPGLPKIPFLLLASSLFALAYSKHSKFAHKFFGRHQPQEIEQIRNHVNKAKKQKALTDQIIPTMPELSIDIASDLSEHLGLNPNTNGPSNFEEILPKMREAVFYDTGVQVPGIRINANVTHLNAETIVIRLKDVPIHIVNVSRTRILAIEDPEKLRNLGLDVEATTHPLMDAPVSLIKNEDQKAVQDLGVGTWDCANTVILHLLKVIRQNLKQFVGIQESFELLKKLETAYPELVQNVVPKMVSLQQLTDILRRLVDEGVSIRNLKAVLEALAEFAEQEEDNVILTEHVRSALSLQIAHEYCGQQGEFGVIILDPVIEDAVRESIHRKGNNSYLVLDPEVRRNILSSSLSVLQHVASLGVRQIILTQSDIRRYIRKLFELDFPQVSVLSIQELPPQVRPQLLGKITIEENI